MRAAARRPAPGPDPTRLPGARPGPLPERRLPQLTQLVAKPPDGPDWLHEIKLDGYRFHARLERGGVGLLTRKGLDWTAKFPAIAAALAGLPLGRAYLDGEICAIEASGHSAFAALQDALSRGATDRLLFFLFDIVHLEGWDLTEVALTERKGLLAELLRDAVPPLQLSAHQVGHGPVFHRHACVQRLEGIISKRVDAPYRPGNRGLWVKAKCLNRQEFVVVGWTDPEGSRPHFGSLLLAYYDADGRLIYAGKSGTGFSDRRLAELADRLRPLATAEMPLSKPPPRGSSYGTPRALSRVHWVRPELVAEVDFLTWTAADVLRQAVFQGLRDDKDPRDVRRSA